MTDKNKDSLTRTLQLAQNTVLYFLIELPCMFKYSVHQVHKVFYPAVLKLIRIAKSLTEK